MTSGAEVGDKPKPFIVKSNLDSFDNSKSKPSEKTTKSPPKRKPNNINSVMLENPSKGTNVNKVSNTNKPSKSRPGKNNKNKNNKNDKNNKNNKNNNSHYFNTTNTAETAARRGKNLGDQNSSSNNNSGSLSTTAIALIIGGAALFIIIIAIIIGVDLCRRRRRRRQATKNSTNPFNNNNNNNDGIMWSTTTEDETEIENHQNEAKFASQNQHLDDQVGNHVRYTPAPNLLHHAQAQIQTQTANQNARLADSLHATTPFQPSLPSQLRNDNYEVSLSDDHAEYSKLGQGMMDSDNNRQSVNVYSSLVNAGGGGFGGFGGGDDSTDREDCYVEVDGIAQETDTDACVVGGEDIEYDNGCLGGSRGGGDVRGSNDGGGSGALSGLDGHGDDDAPRTGGIQCEEQAGIGEGNVVVVDDDSDGEDDNGVKDYFVLEDWADENRDGEDVETDGDDGSDDDDDGIGGGNDGNKDDIGGGGDDNDDDIGGDDGDKNDDETSHCGGRQSDNVDDDNDDTDRRSGLGSDKDDDDDDEGEEGTDYQLAKCFT